MGPVEGGLRDGDGDCEGGVRLWRREETEVVVLVCVVYVDRLSTSASASSVISSEMATSEPGGITPRASSCSVRGVRIAVSNAFYELGRRLGRNKYHTPSTIIISENGERLVCWIEQGVFVVPSRMAVVQNAGVDEAVALSQR